MSKKTDLIKKVVKTNGEHKLTFGTDPNDPWSARANVTEETLNETALLNRYLKSRGINPEFVSKDQKVSHSKTNQFKIWMRAHVNDPIRESMSQEHTPTQKRLHALRKAQHMHKEIRVADGHKKLHSEAVDKKDTITFDIPLLIRVLEFAREDLKSDINLHKMVERLLSIRGRGTLTMNEYGRIVKEEVEQLDEISKKTLASYAKKATDDVSYHSFSAGTRSEKDPERLKDDQKAMKRQAGVNKAIDRLTKEEIDESNYGPRADKLLAHSHNLYQQARKETDTQKRQNLIARSDKSHGLFLKAQEKHYQRNPGARPTFGADIARDYEKREAKYGAGHVRDHVEIEGDLIEAKEANYGSDYQSMVLRVKEKAKKKPVDIASLAARMQAAYKKEDEKNKPVKEDFFHGSAAAVGMPFDGANNPDDTIPAKRSNAARIVKSVVKKTVKEELYDHEKEDKPVTTPGKKTRLQKLGVDAATKESPQAAAVLTGGKTLTGEPRDTIEIDPMMKMKKQSPDSKKSV